MRLSWNKSYHDYADAKHWKPILQQLQNNFLNIEDASCMEVGILLDKMEQIHELMLYYMAEEDFERLEPVMRKQEILLEIVKRKQPISIGYRYLEMEFARINGALYRRMGKNSRAAECYTNLLIKIEQCFHMLKGESTLNDEQKLFVGWACACNYGEAAATFEMVADIKKVIVVYQNMVEVLHWIEIYLPLAREVYERTADFYSQIAGFNYRNQNSDEGICYYKKAIEILNKMSEYYKNDYYLVKAIWTYGKLGLQDAETNHGNQIIFEAEKEAKAFLKNKIADDIEKGILQSVIGMAGNARSVEFLRKGNIQEAIVYAEESCRMMDNSLITLEEKFKEQEKNSYERAKILAIAVSVYSGYLGTLEWLGVQYFFQKDFFKACSIFNRVFELITNTEDYGLEENYRTVLIAEASHYMAMIKSNNNEIDKAEFYAMQAADIVVELAQKSSQTIAWELSIRNCALISEISLLLKKKNQALKYAEIGLRACDELGNLGRENLFLETKSILQKYKKKASRKIF